MGLFGSNDGSIQEKVGKWWLIVFQIGLFTLWQVIEKYFSEQATDEKNVEENWEVIMQICDEAGKASDQAKSYLRVILKRLANSDPHVGLKAVTVSILCWYFHDLVTCQI